MELRTDDLFLAAYALACGAELAGIETSGRNGRRLALVRLKGDDLAERERAYLSGQATANVTVLRDQVKHVKDLMFEALRAPERREDRDPRREDHAHTHEPSRRAAR